MESIEQAARVTSKGQVTIPAAVRQALGISQGDTLAFRVAEGRVVVEKRGRGLSLAERLAMCDPTAEPNEDAVSWANRVPVGEELL